MSRDLEDTSDIHRTIGRLEGKVESVIVLLRDHKAVEEKQDARLALLENKQAKQNGYIAGVAAGVSATVSLVAALITAALKYIFTTVPTTH